jgi:uncharacterized repeat protein (TIGR01451 family)
MTRLRPDTTRRVTWIGGSALATLLVLSLASIASGAPALTVEPIAWDVIGLDSNDVSDGPSTFPVAARACNVGTDPATSVVASVVWDSVNAFIDLSGPSSLGVDSIAAGGCHDFYFNVQIQRDADAYDTTRAYHIEVTADGVSTVSTPVPRQLLVERLVSQNRNRIDAITGAGGIGDLAPTTVYVGETYTYQLHGSTAPNGYEQLETFLDFPNVIFQILSVDATYTAPVGGTGDSVYADSCSWDPDPTSATYLECSGSGKAGGDIVLTYVVKILSAGSATVSGVIYDFSGSSYHYNSDYGVDTISITALEDADLTVTKSDSKDPVSTGESFDYQIEVTNNGPTDATSVVLNDTLPTGVVYLAASGDGWTCSETGGVVTCTRVGLLSGETSTVTISVAAPDTEGVIANTVEVGSDQDDSDPSNDSDVENTTVLAPPPTTTTTLPPPTTTTTLPPPTTTTTTILGSPTTTSEPTASTTVTAQIGGDPVTSTTKPGELPFTGPLGPMSQATAAALLAILLGALVLAGVKSRRE